MGKIATTGKASDLAAELERADVIGEQSGVMGKGDEEEGVFAHLPSAGHHAECIAALHAEVKTLREANKALTLYCSKVNLGNKLSTRVCLNLRLLRSSTALSLKKASSISSPSTTRLVAWHRGRHRRRRTRSDGA